MIKSLIRKDDAALSKSPSIFDSGEHKIIRAAVSDTDVNFFELRGKVFHIKRHTHKGEDWVNVGPIDGYTPMFNAPVKWVMDKEKMI